MTEPQLIFKSIWICKECIVIYFINVKYSPSDLFFVLSIVRRAPSCSLKLLTGTEFSPIAKSSRLQNHVLFVHKKCYMLQVAVWMRVLWFVMILRESKTPIKVQLYSVTCLSWIPYFNTIKYSRKRKTHKSEKCVHSFETCKSTNELHFEKWEYNYMSSTEITV